MLPVGTAIAGNCYSMECFAEPKANRHQTVFLFAGTNKGKDFLHERVRILSGKA